MRSEQVIAQKANAESSFSESVDLLLQLHALMVAGKDESMEADTVRDEMDGPWHAMNDEEQRIVRGLSADLYSIGKNRQHTDSAVTSSGFANDIRLLVARNAWGELLEHLRTVEADLSPRHVAFVRGLCWAHLGQPNVAIEFLTEAARFAPLTASEEILLLTCYAQSGRSPEILARALRIQESEKNPLLLLKAGEIYSTAAEEAVTNPANDLRQRAIDCIERGFALLDGVKIDPGDARVFEAIAIPSLLHLALNYDQLGNRSKAIEVCKRALVMSPKNPNALMLHGFLTFDGFPSAQKGQFIEQFHDRLTSEASYEPLLN
jgi:tetratricopeptide (TPR) repeat protein